MDTTAGSTITALGHTHLQHSHQRPHQRRGPGVAGAQVHLRLLHSGAESGSLVTSSSLSDITYTFKQILYQVPPLQLLVQYSAPAVTRPL